MMLQACKSGVDLSCLIFSDTHAVTIQVCFILLSTFVTPLFYQGLLEFIIQISNPFGSDPIDLPTPHMREGLRAHLGMYVHGRDIPTGILNQEADPDFIRSQGGRRSTSLAGAPRAGSMASKRVSRGAKSSQDSLLLDMQSEKAMGVDE